MKRPNQFQAGFTVFEILIVIGIIVLLTAIAIPNLNRYQPNLKLSAAAKGLTEDLRYAQQLTITSQQVYSISLDLANAKYQLLNLEAATSTVKEVLLPEGIIFDTASTTVSLIKFNSYGAASTGSSGQIFLKNSNNRTRIINIKPSGYVELPN